MNSLLERWYVDIKSPCTKLKRLMIFRVNDTNLQKQRFWHLDVKVS